MRTTTNPILRRALLAASTGVAALAITACGTASTTAASTRAATTAPVPTSAAPTTAASTSAASTSGTSAAAPTTTAHPAAAPAASTPACTTRDLAISLGQVEGAAGTASVPIVFRNDSLGNCSLTGYPGVDGLVDNGPASSPTSHVPATRTPDGTPVATVVIDPGQEASALVLGSDIPTGAATSCPPVSGFVVTPPDTTSSATLPGALQLCDGLRVRPVVAGATGGL